MKLKILLVLFVIANMAWAQDPYRNLVITEAYMVQGDYNEVYFELTNMGEDPIDLSEIKFGSMIPRAPVFDVWNDPWDPRGRDFFLPESVVRDLQPGDSYVVSIALDFGVNMFNARIPDYGWANRGKRHDMYQYADFLIHRQEKNSVEEVLYPHIKDSTTLWYANENDTVGSTLRYRNTIGFTHLPQIGFYIEHHFTEGDSAVIDQVGNMFDNNGKNSGTSWPVAGVEDATTTALLVRKSSIVEGNLDFANARGVGLDDSEWLPVRYPEGADNWRDTWWTLGNHGDFVLDANTLEPKSDDVTVDFAGKTITVPWGTRRLDGIMRKMEYKPGVAWIYHLNESVEDSLLRSAQNGDKMTVYVFGTTLYSEDFDIMVEEPSEDANIVVPIDHVNPLRIADGEGAITENTQMGKLGWPRVTAHDSGMDSITGGGYGLPHAIRTDTLMKYLEKPSNASWEFVYVDGVERADLKTGDKLKVIAQNGDIKEYFLEVQSYGPSHNANLSAITWPDISLSETDKIIYGWTGGDTIPGFTPASTSFRLTLPFDFEEIPALVPKKEDLNSTVEVTRATSFEGSIEDRTTVFDVTAEDDSIKKSYNVELFKEPDFSNMQPYNAKPFIAEAVLWLSNVPGAAANHFLEICNPGNQVLDLSNYMLVSVPSINASDAIQSTMNVDDWINRYNKYIPGYKWVSQADWTVEPGIVELDLGVNAQVQPGDVFVLGTLESDDHLEGEIDPSDWGIRDQIDVQFFNDTMTYGTVVQNPWGEPVQGIPIQANPNNPVMLFEILNDSIKQGLKPANDPEDFELIDVLGMADGSRWFIAGERMNQRTSIRRKPEVTSGNPDLGASFGTNADDSEWIYTSRVTLGPLNIGQPADLFYMESFIGQHFFNFPTQYMSTVTSIRYKVSKGFSMEETITGILNGTTASEFLDNIYKADSAQTLTLKATADGSELAMDDVVSVNDTLVVLSADSTNTTKYILDVGETGLSSNAVLTSTVYDITVDAEPKSASETTEDGAGSVKGFEYGTLLSTVVNNVSVPEGASMSIIDGSGAYVPLTMLNFDTSYVDVTVNANTYFEVTAENGVTRILFQLQPTGTASDAFVTSDVYDVGQNDLLIKFVPRGTSVPIFLSNVVPSLGATMKVVGKDGIERTEGAIVQDDRLIVTSEDGLTQAVYFLSMLRNELVPSTTYLAYITSNVYEVDQFDYMLNGVSGSELIADFYSRITPSMGATAIVVDAEGNEKTTGDIDRSDKVMVTSADGAVIVEYTFGPLTSIQQATTSQIDLYPNPTDSRINIEGLNPGSRIQVYNAFGKIIGDEYSQTRQKTISLVGESAGLYIIVISDNNSPVGKYKVLKK